MIRVVLSELAGNNVNLTLRIDAQQWLGRFEAFDRAFSRCQALFSVVRPVAQRPIAKVGLISSYGLFWKLDETEWQKSGAGSYIEIVRQDQRAFCCTHLAHRHRKRDYRLTTVRAPFGGRGRTTADRSRSN